ncbi:MaoC family dehydratase [Mycolicibacterium sp.]|uniref:MaoC family dehydratase n=1 Tax=Mycolicibacterium sp. TaxID=2320850 RepID=UPI003D1459F1
MTEVLRRTFDQSDLDAFGAVSGGDGRIHTDPDYAAGTRYGRTLVQGMLLVALMERAVGIALPGRRLDARLDITFVAPVHTGVEIRINVAEKGDRPRFDAVTDTGVVMTATLDPTGQG